MTACPCSCHGQSSTYGSCDLDGGCGQHHRGSCLCCGARQSGDRYACHRCVTTMRRWLREIELYAAWLPLMQDPLRGDVTRRAPGYASTPPLRLDVVVALDSRSRPSASVDRDFDPEIDDEDPTVSILGRLHSIARWIREEQQMPEPTAAPTITREVGYLLGAVEWCAGRQWVQELFLDIRELHDQDRSLAKDRPPGPLATCLTVGCEASVFWARDVPDPDRPSQTLDAARCGGCHRQYIGTDLVRLRAGRREAG